MVHARKQVSCLLVNSVLFKPAAKEDPTNQETLNWNKDIYTKLVSVVMTIHYGSIYYQYKIEHKKSQQTAIACQKTKSSFFKNPILSTIKDDWTFGIRRFLARKWLVEIADGKAPDFTVKVQIRNK